MDAKRWQSQRQITTTYSHPSIQRQQSHARTPQRWMDGHQPTTTTRRRGDRSWLGAHMTPLRQVTTMPTRDEMATAWDEGYAAAEYMAKCWGHVDSWEGEPSNPYRAAEPGVAVPEPDEHDHDPADIEWTATDQPRVVAHFPCGGETAYAVGTRASTRRAVAEHRVLHAELATSRPAASPVAQEGDQR